MANGIQGIAGIQGITRAIDGVSRLRQAIEQSPDPVEPPLTPVQRGEQARQQDEKAAVRTPGPGTVNHQSPPPGRLDGEITNQGDPDAGTTFLPMGVSNLLGSGATRYINHSPTMTRQLETLENQGWTVKYAEEGEPLGVDTVEKIIRLNPENNGNRDDSVRELSLDVGLAINWPGPDELIDASSLRAYVYDSMKPYAQALENQYTIRNEVYDPRNWAEFGDFGLSVGDERNDELQNLLASGETGDVLYDHIIDIYRDEPVPGTDHTYEDQFTDDYNEFVPGFSIGIPD